MEGGGVPTEKGRGVGGAWGNGIFMIRIHTLTNKKVNKETIKQTNQKTIKTSEAANHLF